MWLQLQALHVEYGGCVDICNWCTCGCCWWALPEGCWTGSCLLWKAAVRLMFIFTLVLKPFSCGAGVGAWVIPFSWALALAAVNLGGEIGLCCGCLTWEALGTQLFVQPLHANISHMEAVPSIGLKIVSRAVFSVSCSMCPALDWFLLLYSGGGNTKWKRMSGTEIGQETYLKTHAISCLEWAFLIFSLHV